MVVALVLMLAPSSFANEWFPPDLIRMIEAPALQPDSSGSKGNVAIASPDDPKDIGALYANEWLPLDVIQIIAEKAFPSDSSGSKGQQVLTATDDPKEVKRSGRP
jgi:hypothetical protein